jgi:hypothetical protein
MNQMTLTLALRLVSKGLLHGLILLHYTWARSLAIHLCKLENLENNVD